MMIRLIPSALNLAGIMRVKPPVAMARQARGSVALRLRAFVVIIRLIRCVAVAIPARGYPPVVMAQGIRNVVV